jgi:hypothetical protein
MANETKDYDNFFMTSSKDKKQEIQNDQDQILPITLASLEKAMLISGNNLLSCINKSCTKLKNKENIKPYERDFLISLKNKNESRFFPEILRSFTEILLPMETRYALRGTLRCSETIQQEENESSSSSEDSLTETDTDETESECEYSTKGEDNSRNVFKQNGFDMSTMELYERRLFIILEDDRNDSDSIFQKIKVRTEFNFYRDFWNKRKLVNVGPVSPFSFSVSFYQSPLF